ncbi:type II toxin-antitoxin system VapC family toxin [Methyloceanibacter sp.]|uniref:type II toxin-antitoxin system VapC family toxin n=1 Tax=Methyloceanibacter sp. TaxID=1965321 RepID=UPI003D6CA7C1
MSGQPLLLDTCALIWLARDEPLDRTAVELLDAANDAGVITYISPISAWEVGILVARARLKLLITPQRWFQRFFEEPHVQLADMSPDLLIASSFLPGTPPRDPADRIVAATARDYGCTLLTRDEALLDYGEQGHVRVVRC